jgi:RNA polymerase sigma-70 factor, ECF subfamily
MALFRTQQGLLEDFRVGRASALEVVYLYYVKVIAKVIREGVVLADARRVMGAHESVREDLVQETFVRAFRDAARAAYDGKRLYQPYLLTICRNLLIDWTRKQGREVAQDAVDNLVERYTSADAATVSDDPSQDWADPETMAVVDRYVLGLEKAERDVYEARYVRCLSQNEAATALGLTRQRIRTIETRLRDGLRDALGDI